MPTREGILAVLDEVRQTGIAYNREEANPGICCQAIAIRGSTSTVGNACTGAQPS